jgi:hypothetical protein
MRTLFYKLYFILTGPLYRRLHRELSMQLQEVVRANIEHHENTSKKLLDELLRLSFIVGGGESAIVEVDETKLLSDGDIAAVMKDVDSNLGLVEICQKHELPLNSVFRLRTKFLGMNEAGIARSRLIEQECTELAKQVETLTIENKRLLSSNKLISSSNQILP